LGKKRKERKEEEGQDRSGRGGGKENPIVDVILEKEGEGKEKVAVVVGWGWCGCGEEREREAEEEGALETGSLFPLSGISAFGSVCREKNHGFGFGEREEEEFVGGMCCVCERDPFDFIPK
jgi:hypothetical protein